MEPRKGLSTFSNVMHVLENNKGTRYHSVVACAGAAGTFVLWWVHLSRPYIFDDAFLDGRISPVWLAVFLAPPFAMVFGLASRLSKPSPGGPTVGPMSGYVHQQELNKQWKIRVGSCIAAVANLLLMFVAGRPSV